MGNPENTKMIAGAVILIVVLLAAGFFLLTQQPSSGDLTVKVTNEEGQPLWRANVMLKAEEKQFSRVTDRDGHAAFTQLPIGKEIILQASGTGFGKTEQKVTLNEQKQQIEVKLEAELENKAQLKTLTFIGPNGEKLEGKKIFVELSCSRGIAVKDQVREVTSGSLEVLAPSGCGALVATVSGTGFETSTHNFEEKGIARLEAIEAGKGTAKISVSDESGNFLDEVEVIIKDRKGIPTGNKKITGFGEALFELEPGSYSAFAYDPALKFGDSEKGFSVEAKQRAEVKLQLSAKPLGKIKVKVVNAAGSANIKKAKVVLETPSGKRTTREYNGKEIELPITESGKSRLSAQADGFYPSAVIEVDSAALKKEAYELKPSSCTPATCGVLKVVVVDEDDLAVQNARVALIDQQNGFYLEEYGLKHTNYAGIASFIGVKSGKYKANVQKYPAEGESSEFEFTQGESKEVKAQVTIGSGTIEVQAIDSDGRPVPFAFAEFSTDYNKLGKLPLNADGKISFATKADKKVFVVVEARDYAPYSSTAIQIYPDKTTRILAVLQKQGLAEKPAIELLSLADESERQVEKLRRGGNYTARFRLTVPGQREFEQIGAFVRTGSEKAAEKDGIVITSVNAPKANVLKGTSYNEPKGRSDDEKNLTNDEAKWASIAWEKGKTKNGTVEFTVSLKVKESATPSKPLPLFYRAFAVTVDGKNKRDPIDSELGEADEVGTKQSLYAQSYRKELFEGSKEECGEEFCYSERAIDNSQDLLLEAPYNFKVFSEYEFSFSLTNNSTAVHDNAKLFIKNTSDGVKKEEKLRFKSYSITNADARETKANPFAFEIGEIALGEFRKNKSITGRIVLKPEVVGETGVQLQVVSDKKIVFTKLVKILVVKEKDMNVSVQPETLPAFTEFDLNVSVSTTAPEGEFTQIEGALVRVERTTPDRAKSVFTSTTDGEGKATIRVPASAPGTLISVRVEKPGLEARTVKRQVSKEIVSFKPTALNISLDLTTNTERKTEVVAENLVPISLKFSKLGMRGNFSGLLNETRIGNWLQQYVDKTNLEQGTGSPILVLTALSENAKRITEQKRINATLLAEVTNESRTATWALEVPVKITIGLAEPPKTNNCLGVSLKEWKDATLGGKAETEFSITNNCITQNDKPLELRNLKAKVKWKGNQLGNAELHVQNTDSGQEAAEVLGEGTYSTLFDSVPAGKEMLALLTFTPKGGTRGKKAEFEVIIDASQLTNAGEELVGASNTVKAEIDIIDLGECIKYTPDAEAGLVLQETEEEGMLEVDSSKCGNAEIDFWLCKDNKDCSGGTEGGIIVQPEKFKLTPTSPTKKIQVARQEVPGIYGINVNIRTPRSNYREIAVVDVLVKPTPNDAFTLRKYEFTLKGNGAKDSTELTNRFFVQNINVDASMCDWGEASEKEWWNWTGAGVGTVVGAVKGMVAANAAAHGATKSLAGSLWTKLFGAKTAQKAAQAATQTSVATLDSVCSEVQASRTSAVTAQANCTPPNPASAATTTALGEIEAAAAECAAAQAEAKAFNEVNGEALSALEQGIGYDGSVGWVATGEQLIAKKQALDQAILAKLKAAAAKLEAAAKQYEAALPLAEGYCEVDSLECEKCSVAGLPPAISQQEAASKTLESYIAKEYGESIAKTGTAAAATAATKAAAVGAKTAISPALSAATSTTGAFSPTTIFAAYTIGGFFIGGVLPGLFGPDPCDQRHSNDLPDYMINMLSDSGKIDSDNTKFSAEYNRETAKIIGNYKEQRIGVVFTNNGVSSQRPSYSTFTFNATQHAHSNPTQISRGNSGFGPFNVPDREEVKVAAKLHLKFKTQEAAETLPQLEFDTLSCVSGNKVGRTGEKALPRVKLNWNFGASGIDKDSCLESNPNGLYCDATQFSIMLSKRLKSLKEFFDRNPSLKCPANPLTGELASITRDLNAGSLSATGCHFGSWSGYIEGEPAIKFLIEANDSNISWTQEIPNKEAFMGTVHFNALLMQDAYTPDFMNDFAELYSTQRFFETPEWFTNIGVDSGGRKYGIGRLFEQQRVKLTNRFFDSPRLSSAGTYEVLLNTEGNDGMFRFFRNDGTPNVNIRIETYLLQEPNPNSVFYSLPFDGLVGLNGDTFDRQGYGVAYNNRNSAELVSLNKEPAPVKTFNDRGSNPSVFVDSGLEKGLFELNTSPSGRGSLLIAEKMSAEKARLSFRPSKATPLMLKVKAETLGQENLAAYYTLSSSEVPIDVGSTLTYWEGAGACLAPSGLVVTEAFDEKPDRAALSKDPVQNWESAYAVDYGTVAYTGDSYLRTILYTNPLEETTISADFPLDKMQFLTPDSSGQKVRLGGVTGVPFNNPAGGSQGSVQAVSDVFGLVKEGKVCVVDSGRKASFFWNPKAVYEMQGRERNISEFTNSLKAGQTCIGFG